MMFDQSEIRENSRKALIFFVTLVELRAERKPFHLASRNVHVFFFVNNAKWETFPLAQKAKALIFCHHAFNSGLSQILF